MHPQRAGPFRIGLDGDTLGRNRTGDESYLASLMRALARIDDRNDYRVYVRDAEAVGRLFGGKETGDRSQESGEKRQTEENGLPRFTFRTVRPRSIWLRHPVGFPLALRRDPVDLLHVQYFVPPFCRCPVVITVHDISFAARPEFFTLRDRLLLSALVPPSLRRADRIITDARHTKNEFVRIYGLDPARIEVIPLAADPRYRVMDADACRGFVRQRHGLDAPGLSASKASFILYVGTLQPRKNPHTLIDAYAMFRRRSGLPHKLLIVGKLKYKYGPVFDAIARSGVEQDIIFTGFVPDDDLPRYYNAADLFVFPSQYEGFGLPVVEAMACGTPVITTNVSSLPEVAGDAAILVDPLDAEAFCEAMTRVLTEPQIARELRDAGLAQAASFSWDRTARETLAVYNKVLLAGE
ncbi:MAG: glycosyltransferase family 4 protein [Planctomycetes bacterium]|nr:glycosyltransferase family 4 protein [Planctomycetota bacterium]